MIVSREEPKVNYEEQVEVLDEENHLEDMIYKQNPIHAINNPKPN